jgi:hypothetical protein
MLAAMSLGKQYFSQLLTWFVVIIVSIVDSNENDVALILTSHVSSYENVM